jgi:hypothetical protein
VALPALEALEAALLTGVAPVPGTTVLRVVEAVGDALATLAVDDVDDSVDERAVEVVERAVEVVERAAEVVERTVEAVEATLGFLAVGVAPGVATEVLRVVAGVTAPVFEVVVFEAAVGVFEALTELAVEGVLATVERGAGVVGEAALFVEVVALVAVFVVLTTGFFVGVLVPESPAASREDIRLFILEP